MERPLGPRDRRNPGLATGYRAKSPLATRILPTGARLPARVGLSWREQFLTIQAEPLKSVSDMERAKRSSSLAGRLAALFGGPRWRAYAPLAVLIALCVIIAIANPNFIEPRNLVRVANSAAVPLTLALGLTFIILLGSIDLSIEGAVSVAAMVLVLLAMNDANGNNYGWFAVIAAVAAATLMGLINGLVQTYLRIPSFMATLGMWFIGLGVAVYMLGGSAIRLTDGSIRALALTRVLDLPLAVWVAAGAFILAMVIQSIRGLAATS